eukprot:TRINITY_DN127_c1_g2_i1.p1 TRINITY_DN127_c1_g2~~TRINITY_DN127_c1_g2_i1.p1  ORF type:complete len:189 (-),score=18.66 TRINITY_DN127_c1_g2_i1:186-752(-)
MSLFQNFLKFSCLFLATLSTLNFFILAVAMDNVKDFEKDEQVCIYFLIFMETLRTFIINFYGLNYFIGLWVDTIVDSDLLIAVLFAVSAIVQIIIIIVFNDSIFGEDNCSNCETASISDSCDIDDLSCQIESACVTKGISYFAQVSYVSVLIEAATVIVFFIFFTIVKILTFFQLTTEKTRMNTEESI